MNKNDMEYYRQILLKEKDKVINLIDEIEDDTVSEDDFKNSSCVCTSFCEGFSFQPV